MTTSTAVAEQETRTATLLGLIKRAMQRGYSVRACIARDYVTTRAKRLKEGGIEGELYEDGSGFEIAFRGYVFILGVERSEGHCAAVST